MRVELFPVQDNQGTVVARSVVVRSAVQGQGESGTVCGQSDKSDLGWVQGIMTQWAGLD